MFVLKDYQEWALDALRDYFQECSRTGDADTSFYAVTKKIRYSGRVFLITRYRNYRACPISA